MCHHCQSSGARMKPTKIILYSSFVMETKRSMKLMQSNVLSVGPGLRIFIINPYDILEVAALPSLRRFQQPCR